MLLEASPVAIEDWHLMKEELLSGQTVPRALAVSRFLYDTTVFVYAVGRDHPYRESYRAIMRAARAPSPRGPHARGA